MLHGSHRSITDAGSLHISQGYSDRVYLVPTCQLHNGIDMALSCPQISSHTFMRQHQALSRQMAPSWRLKIVHYRMTASLWWVASVQSSCVSKRAHLT